MPQAIEDQSFENVFLSVAGVLSELHCRKRVPKHPDEIGAGAVIDIFQISDSILAVSDVTQILQRVEHGDLKAAEELLPLVYEELRRLAAHKMSLQPPGQTLQATALVHEAYLRLVGNEEKRWESRRHFFSAAAEAMRHILIDRARRRLRVRHGENVEKVPLDEVEISAPANDEIVVALNEALEELQRASPEQAEIVKLRFFVGLTEPEIAEVLHLSERSVQRHWSYAKAWLFDRIETMRS
ncbi:MAG TPA: sigma-70 family RNA polymerase sigma factor [Verrucomicrobiae bacterium]|nr:sigma-70 family RNA polymerase sigma factor [Verrucomicrobiae bacterium]